MLRASLVQLILTAILTIAPTSAANSPAKSYREFDACGGTNGFPLGQCRHPQNCGTLESYIRRSGISFDQVPDCGFLNAFDGKMYCCPNSLSEPPVRTTKSPQTFRFTNSHLVTLSYLKPITLDTYVYRCTGVLLSPTHVLATSLCNVDKPSEVLLGSNDVRLYDDSEIEALIKSTSEYQNELVLFELKTKLAPDQLRGNVSIAKLCEPKDLLRPFNLFAAGYSYDMQEGNSCNKFTQQVQRVNLNQCRNVQQKRRVQNLAVGESHFCIQPVASSASPDDNSECSKCLTFSSSVLHVQREDGSQCVAGIATPTSDECVAETGPLYFTNLMTYAVSDFFNGIIVGQST